MTTRRTGDPHHDLWGRRQELAALDTFVDDALHRGGAQLVIGDAGMGKTVLLDAAVLRATTATDAAVLRASGVEFEAELGYAGLNQLLLPITGALDQLPATQRAVLAAALGLEATEAPELLALATATVMLLRHASQSHPLLLVLDDLQWVDRASLLLLSVVARRLHGCRVALLLAQRSGHETFFDSASIPTLVLSRLGDADARALLDAHHPTMHPSVQRRIVDDAGGNPLALIELPRALSAAQEDATDTLPPTLPLSERLRRLFASRVAALPAPSRRLLLLAALHYGDDAELMRIIAGSAADLAPAEEAGLVSVEVDSHRLRFGHPLIRAAAVDLASAPERRAAHRRLAQLATDPDVRALHLAESTLGVDDDVARLLDAVAESSIARGDGARAVTVLLRAADITSVAADRARRLAAAAYLGANVTGTLTGARALLERARTADADAAGTLDVATAAAAQLLNGEGDVDTAHRLLTRALAETPVDGADPRALEQAVHTLMMVCVFGGRCELWAPFNAALARWSSVLSPQLRLAAVTFTDPLATAPEHLAELDRLIAGIDDEPNPVTIVEVALAGHYVDRHAADALDRVVRTGRDGDRVALVVQARIMQSIAAFLEGRWREAEACSDEATALCAAHGYTLLEWGALNARMLLAAARGESAFLVGPRSRMRHWAIPRHALAVRTFTTHVDGLEALSLGNFDAAHEAYASITAPGTFARHEPVLAWNVLDVVEAALRSGHPDDARRHAAAAASSSLAWISPRTTFLCAAATALVAPDEEYVATFDAVVGDPAGDRWPFVLARVELAYGERLRLDRAMRRARPHLERARDLFAALDARPWLARTEGVLRATGGTRMAAASGGGARLTPQELQVVQLAASGLSNREIGQQLLMSPRTVGAHLYRAFPKLDVTSRAALRDALARLTEAERTAAVQSSD